MARKVEIRSRREALARVAGALGGQLQSGRVAQELLNYEDGELGRAETERLDWAVEYVRERLARMGGPAQ